MKVFPLQLASRSFEWSSTKNKLNVEITGYSAEIWQTASNQGFFIIISSTKANGSYIIAKELNLANKLRGHLLALVLHPSAPQCKFCQLHPSHFPNNNDIRHSASIGVIYDINLGPCCFCGRYLEKRPTLYESLQRRSNNTKW
jgi:hypothetical protein